MKIYIVPAGVQLENDSAGIHAGAIVLSVSVFVWQGRVRLSSARVGLGNDVVIHGDDVVDVEPLLGEVAALE